MDIREKLNQPDQMFIGVLKNVIEEFKLKSGPTLLFYDKDPRLFPDAVMTRDPLSIINTITELGDEMVADRMSGGTPTLPSHIAVGTGTPSPNSPAATGLGTELARVALDSTTKGTGANDNDVIWVATFPAGTGTGALTEAGVFNAGSGGTMFCFATFGVVTKAALDVIVFIWTLTCGDS